MRPREARQGTQRCQSVPLTPSGGCSSEATTCRDLLNFPAVWAGQSVPRDHEEVMKRLKGSVPVEQLVNEQALSTYQQAPRDRLLAAPVLPAPEPWRPVFEYEYGVPVGGILEIGFASHPENGHDLVMVVSHDGGL